MVSSGFLRLRAAAVWAAIQLAVVAPSASAGALQRASTSSVPVASAAHVDSRGATTILSFSIDSPVFGRAYVLTNPDRVVVDMSEVEFKIDPSVGQAPLGQAPLGQAPLGQAPLGQAPLGQAPVGQAPVGAVDSRRAAGGAIASFRFGLIEPGKSRIVVDLARPVRVVRAETRPAPGGKEFFDIELQDTGADAFAAAAVAAPPASAGTAASLAPQDDTPPSAASTLPVVVLDPGHGGIDTGAIGRSNVEEKNVTFAFAQDVADKLRADGRVKVVLTRTADVFVPLETRVKIARQANASLFMSIHADSILGAGSVSGATVYTLSDKASDREAARVAQSENDADAAGGLSATPSGDEDEVKDILMGLTRRETRTYSNFFADSLMKNFSSAGALNHNPHRSASFVVLKAPDVPSVLLELGYLSSYKDLRSLTSDAWRRRAATAVAHAVEAFFAARGVGEASPQNPGAADAATPPATDETAAKDGGAEIRASAAP